MADYYRCELHFRFHQFQLKGKDAMRIVDPRFVGRTGADVRSGRDWGAHRWQTD
jgi:hypothetical protein